VIDEMSGPMGGVGGVWAGGEVAAKVSFLRCSITKIAAARRADPAAPPRPINGYGTGKLPQFAGANKCLFWRRAAGGAAMPAAECCRWHHRFAFDKTLEAGRRPLPATELRDLH
jgi:hypothetical protein